ncbi:hypothetical protein NC653_028463 [Populus alba x Populus x berolinensis]|uniref:Uncharacterized protein n=1 Tax=Populus alba x Populus x berolinensis TaxID=444605 RepID=A0AAD6M0X9_9ROSI|nr:hypothetical protein NC653_028463 [Populus alba x Populus x berolinensis]
MATLEKVSSKVSIILDFWSSYEQIFYMSVTCQWIDENWSFQQVLLGYVKYLTLVVVLRFIIPWKRFSDVQHRE